MFYFIIALHIFVSVFLIFVILLQPGKSDGMAAFSGGGAGSQTVFGGRGSVTFLSKVTTVCAIVFMFTSLTLAWRSSHSDSVLRARRNIAAADAAKKTDNAPLKAPEPTTQTAPPAATGGAAVPVPAAPAGNPPAATTATKPAPAPAPATPKK
jgi:preprotein translocase subunit SecG